MSAPPSPEEAARTVEQASLAFLNATTATERSAAERWLLEIRKWPQPLACCRELLLRSMVGYAKLQALIMMRECLGTQWPMLSPAERSELQQLLLRLLAEGSVEPYVRAAAAQNLAVHAKHDLLHALPPAGSAESGAPAVALETLLQAATQMLEEPSGAHAPAALEIVHATLSEFGAPSSGVVGGALPWSMHARARAAFQTHHLLRAVHVGLGHLQRLYAVPPPLPPPLARTLAQCATVLSSAFSWDFDGVGEAAAVGDARPGLNAIVVKPPSGAPGTARGWMDLLGRSDLVAAVLQLLAAHAPPPGAGPVGGGGAAGAAAEELAHSLRQLLVMLSSVSRRVFDDDANYATYAATLLGGIAELLATAPAAVGGPARAVRGEAAFRDGCVALQRLIVCAGAEALLALPNTTLEGAVRLLHASTMHTVSCAMQSPAAAAEEENDAAALLAEAHDVLLDGWVSLLHGTGTLRRRPPALDDAAYHVYEACVRAKLHASAQAAALCAEEEVDDGAEDADTERERLSALSVLGRARVRSAVPLLLSALSTSGANLQQYCELVASGGPEAAARAGVSAATLEATLEELDCLVALSGHLIADAPEAGETAEPPPEFAAFDSPMSPVAGGAGGAGAEVAAAAASGHPVAALSEGVLRVLRLQLQAICTYDVPPAASPLASALSPALGTSLLHFLRRFACCYLMPDEATCSVLSPTLLRLWGGDTPGAAGLLTLCVDAAVVYLQRWPLEADVAEEACTLLAALARLRAPRRGPAQALSALPSWRQLAGAPPAALPPKAQQLLLEGLSRAAAAIADDATRDATLRTLIAPMPARLQAIASRAGGSPSSFLMRPDVSLEVRACCASLRGIALSCCRETVAITAEGLGPCLQQLLHMVPAYAPAAEPLAALLKVHRDLARTAAPLLPPPAAQAFAEHCAQLVQSYAQHAPEEAAAGSGGGGGGGRGRGGGGPISEVELEEHLRYKQIKTLLQMLTYLAERDVDRDDAQYEAGYTHALGMALSALLPCVTEPMLLYPKLSVAYFGTLSAWLEGRPLAAVSMPPPLYEAVLASLRFGFAHHDASICRGALETAFELARRAAEHGHSAAPMEALLRQLLERVAADLLTSRLHPEVIEPAGSNALLALIVAQPAHWQALVAALVGAQPSAEAAERAAALFGALLTSNGVTATLARPNRTRFRANLEGLLRGVTAANLVLPQ
jgi:hypothetical protein